VQHLVHQNGINPDGPPASPRFDRVAMTFHPKEMLDRDVTAV